MTLSEEQTRISTRQELLEQTFQGLKDHLGTDFERIWMNRIVLHDVVVSYFDDVDRHKEYHRTKRVNEAKQAAFMMKWITKLRPIQFDVAVEEATLELQHVNEVYAMRCGFAFMGISPSVLPDELYAEMLYTLHYRSVDERLLFVWLATIENSLDGNIELTR